jgi:hypothetical protein
MLQYLQHPHIYWEVQDDIEGTSCLFLAQQPKAGQGRQMLEVCRSHTITTFGRTPLNEGSTRPRGLYPTIQHPQETNINAPAGLFLYFIRTWLFVLIVLYSPFTCTTQHTHPCRRRDSNPQSQTLATGIDEGNSWYRVNWLNEWLFFLILMFI